jgi:hypothetical protein
MQPIAMRVCALPTLLWVGHVLATRIVIVRRVYIAMALARLTLPTIRALVTKTATALTMIAPLASQDLAAARQGVGVSSLVNVRRIVPVVVVILVTPVSSNFSFSSSQLRDIFSPQTLCFATSS